MLCKVDQVNKEPTGNVTTTVEYHSRNHFLTFKAKDR